MKANRPIIDTGRIRFAGMTLVELMVALAIGSFLMLGAITVFMQGRSTFRVNESIARLQENGRFALDAIEPDIRMAHYFGLTTRAGKIANRARQTETHASGLSHPGDCGDNWAIDLANAVEGENGGYPWSACPAYGDGAQPGSDALAIRRAERQESTPEAGRMYIQTWRLLPGEIFTGATPPTSDATSAIHALVVNGYYVSQDSSISTDDNPVPSLRRKTLVSGPAIRDEEVLPGVEDFQVQFGVDTDTPDTPGRGSVNRFVNPGDPIITAGSAAFLPDAKILAVRIWVRVRAERPETGYENTNSYVYADESFTADDAFRRALFSKTIYLRNTRPAS